MKNKHMPFERKDSSNSPDPNEMVYLDIPFQIKSLHDDEDDPDFFVFEGLASTFGNIDSHDDIILPGAFAKTLSIMTPVILWQHDTFEPIGMPIEIRETTEGLFVKARLPRNDDLVKGRVIPQMKVGSIRTMSIGFRTIESEFNTDTGIRILKEIKLFEISLVTFAANSQAVVTGFKSKNPTYNIEQVKEFTERDLEKALRESGFSKDASMYLVSKFTKLGEPASNEMTVKTFSGITDILDSFAIKQLSQSVDKL